MDQKATPGGWKFGKRQLSVLWQIVNDTIDEFSEDRGDLVAAALAFYTLLAIAPLIIIAVAIAGVILGQGAARAEVIGVLDNAMGAEAARTVQQWVEQASEAGGVASVVGAILLLFTASRLGAQLRSALNLVWNVDVEIAKTFKATVSGYVERRLFAFALVLAAGPLLVVVFVSRALLSGVEDVFLAHLGFGGALAQLTQLAMSIVLVAALTAATFRFVPDTRVGWSAIWRGALITSVLFNLGNLAVGLYLARAGVVAAYGAAGSAVVVLLWLYFSAQMFLYGAEFTQVYAKCHVRPHGAGSAR